MGDKDAEAIARLSERDWDILGALIWAYDHNLKYGRDGVSPLDCGGHDGSDHSYRLTKLVKLGLAEHRKGREWGKASTRFRGSKKYRPTDAGRRAAEIGGTR